MGYFVFSFTDSQYKAVVASVLAWYLRAVTRHKCGTQVGVLVTVVHWKLPEEHVWEFCKMILNNFLPHVQLMCISFLKEAIYCLVH